MAIAGSTDTTEYGIALGWSNNMLDSLGNTVNPQTLIERTTGAVAASTADWTRIVTTWPNKTAYTDVLPADGNRRWYRIQHVLVGYTASTWLGTVDAIPTELFEV